MDKQDKILYWGVGLVAFMDMMLKNEHALLFIIVMLLTYIVIKK